MKEKFLNKQVEYFWEYDYPFLNEFLKDIFGDECKRKYSLIGDGIFNLVYKDGKIYHLKLTQAKTMLVNDNKITTDKTKNEIVKAILDNLDNTEVSTNNGKYITFKLGNYIAKIEIIKKMKEPQ